MLRDVNPRPSASWALSFMRSFIDEDEHVFAWAMARLARNAAEDAAALRKTGYLT